MEHCLVVQYVLQEQLIVGCRHSLSEFLVNFDNSSTYFLIVKHLLDGLLDDLLDDTILRQNRRVTEFVSLSGNSGIILTAAIIMGRGSGSGDGGGDLISRKRSNMEFEWSIIRSRLTLNCALGEKM